MTASVLRILAEDPDREWTRVQLKMRAGLKDVSHSLGRLESLGWVSVEKRRVLLPGSDRSLITNFYRVTGEGVAEAKERTGDGGGGGTEPG
ncbi:hypothetical protein [Rhizohabitans arisaemae]|uniref:hypothetical protein n=1 Tax=Rhizohabitans arisaemae TaxID=2720610 RepID=UPI0024B24B2A|nr:hypothetical protein [Rhizohabitans arisaemae]